MFNSRSARIAIAASLLTAVSSMAMAKTCDVTIAGDDRMKFDTAEIAVAADCTEINLTLNHTGKLPVAAMGHNWVLTETSAFQAVATAGASAGPAASYLPKNDARVLAHTKLVGGGESTSIKFSTAALKKGGDYTFFCSFPGHWAVMKGKFKFG
jgi:azurin